MNRPSPDPRKWVKIFSHYVVWQRLVEIPFQARKRSKSPPVALAFCLHLAVAQAGLRWNFLQENAYIVDSKGSEAS